MFLPLMQAASSLPSGTSLPSLLVSPSGGPLEREKPKCALVGKLQPPRETGASPCQLQWGVFGTRFACMYSDGSVCVWKIIAPDTWELTSNIPG